MFLEFYQCFFNNFFKSSLQRHTVIKYFYLSIQEPLTTITSYINIILYGPSHFISVSYTHLDVYKRQTQMSTRERGTGRGLLWGCYGSNDLPY